FDETQRLYKESEQRAAELAIINTVQQSLASQLSIQGIYDAVGDKVREIFHQADLAIRIFDPKAGLVHVPYCVEDGERTTVPSFPLKDQGLTGVMIRSGGRVILINQDMAGQTMALAGHAPILTPGTKRVEKSTLWVPLKSASEVRGAICLFDMESEHAFTDAHVRLLET